MGKKASNRHSAYLVMQGALAEHIQTKYKYQTREIDELAFITKYETLPPSADGYKTGDVMGLINAVGPTKKQVLFGVGIARCDKNGEAYLAESSVEHKLEEAKRFIRDYKKYIAETENPNIPNNGSEIQVILRKTQSAIDLMESSNLQEVPPPATKEETE